MKKTAGQLSVLVSSTVYGVEELLERIYVLLTQYGYDVWMSHKGTMPVLPDRSNSENCLAAVEACDLFLGIITTQYGSGKTAKGLPGKDGCFEVVIPKALLDVKSKTMTLNWIDFYR